MKFAASAVFALLAAAPLARADEAPAPSAEGSILAQNPVIEHVQVAHGATPAEISSLLHLGHVKYDKGDYDSAEIAFMQVLTEHATKEEIHDAMLGLARTYRKKSSFTKAAAVYERFVKDYSEDVQLPLVYLELGRTLRALGAYKQAIARFYSVLNTTLKVPDASQDEYRQLARTAQYEIADTYFQIGDYAQATRFFSRLKLLDLAPEDRARANFKSVYSLWLSGDDEKAIAGLQNYLELYPEDENVPEARYLLSVSLRRIGRAQDSLRATLDLLRAEDKLTQKDPQRWSYWQRKTGNQLANDFYQSGDFGTAMQIYQNLVRLSNEPAWLLPATYQLGLCYERLSRFDKARECYANIVNTVKNLNLTGPSELTDLSDMAGWRLSQIDWQITTDSQVSSVFTGGTHATDAAKPTIASAKIDDHDSHGNAASASSVVR